MQQWQYRLIRDEGRTLDTCMKKVVSLANELGTEGWEAVGYDVQNWNTNPAHYLVSCMMKRPALGGANTIDVTEHEGASR
jgi:hypothetical protein